MVVMVSMLFENDKSVYNLYMVSYKHQIKIKVEIKTYEWALVY